MSRSATPSGNDGNIIAVPKQFAFTNLKLEVLVVVYRRGSAAETYVDRACHFIGSPDHLPGFYVIRGTHDRHSRNGAHEGEVLAALMAGTVFAHGDAAVSSTDLHV
mgnify:FL=1